jgi:hypothetical protein
LKAVMKGRRAVPFWDRAIWTQAIERGRGSGKNELRPQSAARRAIFVMLHLRRAQVTLALTLF